MTRSGRMLKSWRWVLPLSLEGRRRGCWSRGVFGRCRRLSVSLLNEITELPQMNSEIRARQSQAGGLLELRFCQRHRRSVIANGVASSVRLRHLLLISLSLYCRGLQLVLLIFKLARLTGDRYETICVNLWGSFATDGKIRVFKTEPYDIHRSQISWEA